MFQRNILIELDRWKNSRYRKPLILRGARQVGKTTAVEMFSKNSNSSYISISIKNQTLFFLKMIISTSFLILYFILKVWKKTIRTHLSLLMRYRTPKSCCIPEIFL
jgi:uncharacterized protein